MPLVPLNKQHLTRIQHWPGLPQDEQCLSWLKELIHNPGAQCFVNEGDDQLQGLACFHPELATPGNARVHLYPAQPDNRPGNLELAYLALEEAFTTLNYHKLSTQTAPDNHRLLHHYSKLGFCHEGLLRKSHFDGQHYQDRVHLGILASDWKQCRERVKLQLQHWESLAQNPIDQPHYRIQILCDYNAWIQPFLEELIAQWQAQGHQLFLAHRTEDVHSGDFCFCLSFSRIVSQAVRAQFRHTLVVHESDLPHGRGWAPMTWQILEGAREIPVTLLEAVNHVDAGPVYHQEWIALTGTELNGEWRERQAETTLQLCRHWLQNYPQILSQAREQQGEPSFYPKRRPEHSQLDPHRTLEEQFELLRVVDNQRYPAFFHHRGERYILTITRDSSP